MLAPVARPVVHEDRDAARTSGGSVEPRYAAARRSSSTCSRRATSSIVASSIRSAARTSPLRTRAPPSAIAPNASSSRPGTPSFRTEEDVERSVQRTGHLGRHGHTSARQPQHHDVVPARVLPEPLGELPSRLGPIGELRHPTA
jgi:hypothetical protein